MGFFLLCASAAVAQGESAAELFARGDFPAAATAYQATLESQPNDRAAQLGLATIDLYRNDLHAAEPLLASVLFADPKNSRATRLMTELQRRKAEAGRTASVTGEQAIVPFVASDPLPVVRGVANGVEGNFVVDTGGDVDLEPGFAARAGVQATNSGMGVFAGGRTAAMQAGTLKSLTFPNVSALDVPVHVLQTHAAALFPGVHIDGVIGTTYFERFLVTIDYPNKRLILRARSSQRSAAFEQTATAAGAAIVPCYLAGDHFVFAQAQVNAAPPGLFLFDSGLAGGGVMPSPQLLKAAAISLDQKHAGTGTGGGGVVTTVPFTAQRVAVGSAVQQNVRGLYTPQGSPLSAFPFTVWGFVSNEFLQHYAYTVDFDAMKIVLWPPAPTAASAGDLTPQQIFDAAFRRLQAYPVPPYAVFTDTWHIKQRPMGYYTGEQSSVEVNRYAVRLSDGMENISNPLPSGKLPPAAIEPEFLGPFAWSMRSAIRVAPPGSSIAMQPDLEGLKTIAMVVAVAKPPYTIVRSPSGAIPIVDLDGRAAYHLELRPEGDPKRHNLRDLWIDTQTFDLLKAHFVGTYAPFPQAPLSATDVTVYFRGVLGCWVVAHAIWTYDDPPMAFTFDVTSNELALPPSLPDWLFDAAAYRNREFAGEPDYLSALLERMRRGETPNPST